MFRILCTVSGVLLLLGCSTTKPDLGTSQAKPTSRTIAYDAYSSGLNDTAVRVLEALLPPTSRVVTYEIRGFKQTNPGEVFCIERVLDGERVPTLYYQVSIVPSSFKNLLDVSIVDKCLK